MKENKKALYEHLLYTGRWNKFLKFNSNYLQNKVDFLIDSYIGNDKEIIDINDKLESILSTANKYGYLEEKNQILF